jgi:hypothetical protein
MEPELLLKVSGNDLIIFVPILIFERETELSAFPRRSDASIS